MNFTVGRIGRADDREAMAGIGSSEQLGEETEEQRQLRSQSQLKKVRQCL